MYMPPCDAEAEGATISGKLKTASLFRVWLIWPTPPATISLSSPGRGSFGSRGSKLERKKSQELSYERTLKDVTLSKRGRSPVRAICRVNG